MTQVHAYRAAFVVFVTFTPFLMCKKPFLPLSYTIALVENEKKGKSISRMLQLAINDVYVGGIVYTIQLDMRQPSFINQLHIEQSYRNHKGYGKVLLYQALKDILQSGSASVELERCPFDLPSTDNAEERNEQLKKWYRSFGFQDDNNSRIMRLNPRKLLSTEVVPNFTDNDITFSFRKPVTPERRGAQRTAQVASKVLPAYFIMKKQR